MSRVGAKPSNAPTMRTSMGTMQFDAPNAQASEQASRKQLFAKASCASGVDRWWTRPKGATPRAFERPTAGSSAFTSSGSSCKASNVWDRLSKPDWLNRYEHRLAGHTLPSRRQHYYVDLAPRDLTLDGASDNRHPFDPIIWDPSWRPVRSADGRAAWRARKFTRAQEQKVRADACVDRNNPQCLRKAQIRTRMGCPMPVILSKI